MNFSDEQLPSNRKFGFFFTIIFSSVGAYLFFYGSLIPSYLMLALAGLFLLVTLIRTDALMPLNRLWMKIGLLLGMIIHPIVMGLIFFGLFTPLSLLMKLFGRDELRLKLSDRASHWKELDSDTLTAESFKSQF